MRQAGPSARRRQHRTRTTDSQHDQPVADNVLARDFTASAPNLKWLTDITEAWTAEGWLYLAVVLDVLSRMVVGWAIESHRDEALVAHALEIALGRRQPSPGLLHHSERGSQYTSWDYRARLAQADITVSMSRKGDCYDNAMMESFFSSFKSECICSLSNRILELPSSLGPRKRVKTTVSRAVYMFTQLRRKRYDDISGIDA